MGGINDLDVYPVFRQQYNFQKCYTYFSKLYIPVHSGGDTVDCMYCNNSAYLRKVEQHSEAEFIYNYLLSY